jgi:hypothetical protein
MIGQAISPALAAKGFAGREIVSQWEKFAGQRLGARSRPLKVEWPRRRAEDQGEPAEPATLVVLCESAFAPEAQHSAPVILARINAHLGWKAIGRIALRQGPVEGLGRAQAPSPPEPSPALREKIAAAASPIAGEALRDAVTRLGLAIGARAKA